MEEQGRGNKAEVTGLKVNLRLGVFRQPRRLPPIGKIVTPPLEVAQMSGNTGRLPKQKKEPERERAFTEPLCQGERSASVLEICAS